MNAKRKKTTTKFCAVCGTEHPRRTSSCCDQDSFKRIDGTIIEKVTPKSDEDKKVDRVSAKNVRIITKLVKNVLDGVDFTKPDSPEPTAMEVSSIYRSGDQAKIAETESLLDQWENWNEISSLGGPLVKNYKKTITETLFPKEEDSEE